MNPLHEVYSPGPIACGTRAEWARDLRAMAASDRAAVRDAAIARRARRLPVAHQRAIELAIGDGMRRYHPNIGPCAMRRSAEVIGRAGDIERVFAHPDSLVVKYTYSPDGWGALDEVLPDGSVSCWAD